MVVTAYSTPSQPRRHAASAMISGDRVCDFSAGDAVCGPTRTRAAEVAEGSAVSPRVNEGNGSEMVATMVLPLAMTVRTLPGIERRPRCRELFALCSVHLGKRQVQFFHGVDNGCRDDESGKPFVIGRHHIPGRVRGARVPDHIFVNAHVFPPVPALFDVRGGKLPVLGRQLEPPPEASLLLISRKVQGEFTDGGGISSRIPLEGDDVGEALLPDVFRHQRRRELLVVEKLGMNADDKCLLVVRAIEDADAPTLGKTPTGSPQEIVVQLFARRRLERVDLTT